MSFDFQTQEERDGWEAFRHIYQKHVGVGYCIPPERLDSAAARWDARKATCGIEVGTWNYYALGLICSRDHSSSIPYPYGSDIVLKGLLDKGLVKRASPSTEHNAQQQALIPLIPTDRGREVLANLNAMCKVEG